MDPKQKIKAVFFDLGGVISFGEYKPFLYDVVGDSEHAKDIVACAHGLFQKYKYGQFDEKYYWRHLCENSKVLEVIEKKTVEEGMEYLKNKLRTFFKVNDGVLKIARDVKKLGYKIGIISNHGHEWFWDYFVVNKELEEIWDDKELIIVSSDVKYAKPDKEIYEEMLKRGKAEKDEIIYIEDKDRNLNAAKKYGFQNRVKYDSRKSDASELRKLLQEYMKI